MKVKRDKYIEAIAKIIALTRSNILKWDPVNNSAVQKKNRNDKISSVFRTSYRGKILQIFKRQYQDTTVSGTLRSLALQHTESNWFEEVILEIVDTKPSSLWTFPKEDIIKDLLRTIKFKTSGADDLIDSLVNEKFPDLKPSN